MIQTLIRTTDRDSGAGLLLQTQETYLDLAGNALASAERLRLHRTSLYYRIRHMTELTYTDLKDGGEVSASTWNSSWSGSAAITSGRVTRRRPRPVSGSRHGGALSDIGHPISTYVR
jgi:hypothetical protein